MPPAPVPGDPGASTGTCIHVHKSPQRDTHLYMIKDKTNLLIKSEISKSDINKDLRYN